MVQKNSLLEAPPYAVETAIQRLGAYLRTARLRRNLSIQEMAEKIGTGVRAVTDAEKGKTSTSIGVYIALLWAMDLLDSFTELANPIHDKEGQTLALAKERLRARHAGDLDNDF